jgi:hypothetical protein
LFGNELLSYTFLCDLLLRYAGLLPLFLLPELPFSANRTLVWDILALIVKWLWIALIIGFAKRHLRGWQIIFQKHV